jgi:excisionase family DNA binding protein
LHKSSCLLFNDNTTNKTKDKQARSNKDMSQIKKITTVKNKDFMKVSECAFYLNVSKETIYRWIYNRKKTKFPVVRFGRGYRFYKDDVLSWSLRQKI